MPCQHKFFQHANHLPNNDGLLPNWEIRSMIIGTFNPEEIWVPENDALYFYGRSAYFWTVLPRFALPSIPNPAIENINVVDQFNFLQRFNIGLTDLLIRIEDADIANPHHVEQIRTYKDADIETFNQFEWNTENILHYIETQHIEAVYFTKLGNPNAANPGQNTFEFQMRVIEQCCHLEGIVCHRLHTPTGQGLGIGTPRVNRLTHKWFEDGGNTFPFILQDFNLGEYPFHL